MRRKISPLHPCTESTPAPKAPPLPRSMAAPPLLCSMAAPPLSYTLFVVGFPEIITNSKEQTTNNKQQPTNNK